MGRRGEVDSKGLDLHAWCLVDQMELHTTFVLSQDAEYTGGRASYLWLHV